MVCRCLGAYLVSTAVSLRDEFQLLPYLISATVCVEPCPIMNNLTDKGTIKLIQMNASATAKHKRQLPRARKARVRLRQQNKLRAAAVRNT